MVNSFFFLGVTPLLSNRYFFKASFIGAEVASAIVGAKGPFSWTAVLMCPVPGR